MRGVEKAFFRNICTPLHIHTDTGQTQADADRTEGAQADQAGEATQAHSEAGRTRPDRQTTPGHVGEALALIRQIGRHALTSPLAETIAANAAANASCAAEFAASATVTLPGLAGHALLAGSSGALFERGELQRFVDVGRERPDCALLSDEVTYGVIGVPDARRGSPTGPHVGHRARDLRELLLPRQGEGQEDARARGVVSLVTDRGRSPSREPNRP